MIQIFICKLKIFYKFLRIILKSTCIFSTFMLSYMSMPHNEVKVLPILRSDTVIGE